MGAKKLSNLEIKTPRWAVPHLQPSRYKGSFGGRGSGKSHDAAERVIERCMMSKTDVICGREYQKSLKQSAKRLLEQKIQDLGVGQFFDVRSDKIIAPYNGLIIFEGLQDHNSESIKSFEGFDIFWGEEAQTLSQKTLDLVRPTIRKDGSELWFTWNPRYETDPIDQLLRGENPPPNSIVLEANYMDNPWFPDVLKEEMEYDKRRDPEKYQHVWLGGYVRNSEKRVFKNWTVEEFETPETAHFRLGADWGFSVDPTVLVRCFAVGRKLYIDHEAYQVGCEITDTPALFMTIPEAEKWPMTADSARPETISHVRNNGFPKIYPAVKGKGSVEEGINWLQTYDIIVHPRCKHTIDELTLYSYKTDKDTGKVLPILEDKKNHVIDALRYANEGHRRAEKQKKPKNQDRPQPTYNPWAKRQ
jgi:phage terminase large subunit